MTDTAAVVRFAGVSKSFGDLVVLDDVSLDLQAQRTTAIVGESGSGKSTLLQLVNGLLRPDSGRVDVFGEPVDYEHLVALRRRIGFAVQGASLFPHQTLWQNVTLLAQLEGWDEARRRARFEHLMSMVELDPGLAQRYPHELSGGQQQRASLCRAMMLEPPLLLLDEPFSAVDPITRIGIHEHFERLAASEAVSVLLVTHDMREAVKLAHDLVIIHEGVIARSGPCAEVVADPGHPWIQRLFEEHLQ